MTLPWTITEAAAALRRGEGTPPQLVEGCLARIDRWGRDVRAWGRGDADGARRAAAELGAEAKAGHWRGPLHGIPLGIKDIFDVAGQPTLAGSPLRAGHRAERDAETVARLRAVGAVILGKTETTQFASFD